MPLRPTRTISTTFCLAILTLGACDGSTTGTTITSLNLDSDIAPIGGSVSLSSTAMIDHAGEDLTGVTIQSWINQGTTRRNAGAASIDCGSGPGVLPDGTCTATFGFAASNDSSGIGTLVEGAATLEFRLVDAEESVLGTRSVPVTLVPNTPSIIEMTLSSTTFVIDGPSVNVTERLYNPAGSLSNVVLQGFISQAGATRPAGGFSVFCGFGAGVLPTGGCPGMSSHDASNAGGGMLVPGAATLVIELRVAGVTVHTRTTPVVLQ